MVKFEEIAVGLFFRLEVWQEGENYIDEDDYLVKSPGNWTYPIAFKRDLEGYMFDRRYHTEDHSFLVHTL
jgi:hypothetical protein